MKKHSKRKKEKSQNASSELKTYLFCILKNLGIFAVLFFISGFICLKTGINKDYYYLFALGVSVFCALLGGFSFCRKAGKNGLLNGVISALPLSAIISAASLILSTEGVTAKLPIAIISIILAGAAGGIAGVNTGR